MQPRIYTYKITFEEVPYWYWGSHKEKKFGEMYLGSPKTHKWAWRFYTAKIQILELFPYTDEGWKEAQNLENRCIRPDLSNPLCLNEHCGSVISTEASKRGGKKGAAVSNARKNDFGKSFNAVNGGKKGAEVIHKEKDESGRSLHNLRLHQTTDKQGRSSHAVKMNEKAHAEKDGFGKSLKGIKDGRRLNSQKWEDPDHPELGSHNAGNLVKVQRAHGYPHGPENRRKVTNPLPVL